MDRMAHLYSAVRERDLQVNLTLRQVQRVVEDVIIEGHKPQEAISRVRKTTKVATATVTLLHLFLALCLSFSRAVFVLFLEF